MGILVGFGNDPSRCVGDAEVENLALVGQGVEAARYFFDWCGVVPPVQV